MCARVCELPASGTDAQRLGAATGVCILHAGMRWGCFFLEPRVSAKCRQKPSSLHTNTVHAMAIPYAWCSTSSAHCLLSCIASSAPALHPLQALRELAGRPITSHALKSEQAASPCLLGSRLQQCPSMTVYLKLS